MIHSIFYENSSAEGIQQVLKLMVFFKFFCELRISEVLGIENQMDLIKTCTRIKLCGKKSRVWANHFAHENYGRDNVKL